MADTQCVTRKDTRCVTKNTGKQHKDSQCVKYGHTTTHNVLHRNTADTQCVTRTNSTKTHNVLQRTQVNNTKTHNVLNTDTQQHTMCYIETRRTQNGQTAHGHTDFFRTNVIAIVPIFMS